MRKLIVKVWKIFKFFRWRKGMELCAKAYVYLTYNYLKEV